MNSSFLFFSPLRISFVGIVREVDGTLKKPKQWHMLFYQHGCRHFTNAPHQITVYIPAAIPQIKSCLTGMNANRQSGHEFFE